MKSIKTKIMLFTAFLILVCLGINVTLTYFSIMKSVEHTVSNYTIGTVDSISTKLNTSLYKNFLEQPTENEVYWKLREQLNDIR